MAEVGLMVTLIFGIWGWVFAYFQYVENKKTSEDIQSIPQKVILNLEPILNGKLKSIRSKGIRNFLNELSQKTNSRGYFFNYSIDHKRDRKEDIISWEWFGSYKNLTVGDFSNIDAGILIKPGLVRLEIFGFGIPNKYRDFKPEEWANSIKSELKPKYEQIAADMEVEFKS